MFSHQKLICYQLTLNLAKRVPGILAKWPKGSANLQDQLKRALCSILLNIAEGNGRASSKERQRFFSIARGSATEVSAAIDAAHAMQWMSEEEYANFSDKLLQVVKILFKLP